MWRLLPVVHSLLMRRRVWLREFGQFLQDRIVKQKFALKEAPERGLFHRLLHVKPKNHKAEQSRKEYSEVAEPNPAKTPVSSLSIPACSHRPNHLVRIDAPPTSVQRKRVS